MSECFAGFLKKNTESTQVVDRLQDHLAIPTFELVVWIAEFADVKYVATHCASVWCSSTSNAVLRKC